MLYYNRFSLSKNMPAVVRFVSVAVKGDDAAEVGVFECEMSKYGYPDPSKKHVIQDGRIVALPVGTSEKMLSVLDTFGKIRNKFARISNYDEFKQDFNAIETAREELARQAREAFGLDESWQYVIEGCTYVDEEK